MPTPPISPDELVHGDTPSTAPPQLPDELLGLIMRFVPLCELAGPLRACRAWARQACDDLWGEIALRQWGLRARRGVRDLRALCATEAAAELDHLPAPARRFVCGIARGYCPTDDGCFTYHAPGSTPVHYRHDDGGRDGRAADEGARPECRGRWEWSPDRVHWFDVSESRATCLLYTSPSPRD